MRRRWWKGCLIAVLGCSLGAGCQRAAVRSAYPPDPLLQNKTPVAAKAESARPMVARNEPVVPALPSGVVASAPPRRSPGPSTDVVGKPEEKSAPFESQPAPTNKAASPAVAASYPSTSESIPTPPPTPAVAPTTNAKPPVPIVPALNTKPAPEVAATPVVRQKVDGTYGRAPDHAWLQGVLDRHYRGHFDLRYCDASVEDDWGGKVHLEEDERLQQFQDGDVIYVEGDLVRENGQVQLGHQNHYPRYRIRQVELVRHKEG
jgi:hypothetical protein